MEYFWNDERIDELISALKKDGYTFSTNGVVGYYDAYWDTGDTWDNALQRYRCTSFELKICCLDAQSEVAGTIYYTVDCRGKLWGAFEGYTDDDSLYFWLREKGETLKDKAYGIIADYVSEKEFDTED